jgi:circadian clock protein KaiC
MRPTSLGLEMHLVKMHGMIEEFKPDIVVIDPITALLAAGSEVETRTMLLRLVDFLKHKQITALMTTLTGGTDLLENTQVDISSLVDVWLLLRDVESGGERNRGIYVIKARGVAHSNQIREFVLSSHGVQLRDVYMGPAGLLTGSARVAQEAKEAMQVLETQQVIEQRRLIRQRKRKAIEAQIAALQLDLESEDAQLQQVTAQDEMVLQQAAQDRAAMAKSRSITGDSLSENGKRPKPREGRK